MFLLHGKYGKRKQKPWNKHRKVCVKIYQVEELVGITKKNIRFYEDEGLLNPDRNPENGYREYSLKDVKQLEKIKLLRKLDVSLENIRLMMKGKMSFEEAMNNQIAELEKKQKDAELMVQFCHKMKTEISDLTQLNAENYLLEMNKMETEGTKFVDIEKQDISRKKKSGAVIAAVVIFLIVLISLIPTLIMLFKSESTRFIGLVFLFIGIIFIIGIVIVLKQRLKEINGGEEYEARNY